MGYGTTSFDYHDDSPYVQVQRPKFTQYNSSGGGSTTVVVDTNKIPVYVGEYNVNHSIVVTHPNSSKELYLYCGNTNGSPVSTNGSVSSSVLTAAADHGGLDYGQAVEEGSLLGRNLFYWDRAQTP